jgi:hypothetical protein
LGEQPRKFPSKTEVIMANDNIHELVNAGIIAAEFLTAEDRALLDGLSNQEVRTIIELAKRVYPQDPSATKVADLRTGRLRICIPL